MDFFNVYVMGSIQALTGFYFLRGFLQRKIKSYFYLLFVLFWIVMIKIVPSGGITEFLVYGLLLIASGIVGGMQIGSLLFYIPH